MGLTVVTPATVAPVSLAEMRLYLRQVADDEDSTISALILAATEYAQMVQRRQLVKATLRLTLDAFEGEMYLMRPPVTSVSSITYVDENGATQTLATDQYQVVLTEEAPKIVAAYDVEWPNVREQSAAVAINYVAGYGTSASTAAESAAAVPAATKQAIKMLVCHWFEHREAVLTGSTSKAIELAVDALLAVNSWGHYTGVCS